MKQQPFKLIPCVITLFCLIAIASLCHSDYQDIINGEKPQENSVSIGSGPSNEQANFSSDDKSNKKNKRAQLTGLFGHTQTKIDKAIDKVPMDTRLDLILRGTFTHIEKNKASALIAESNQPSKNYLIGDEIIPGVKLTAIDVGRVTIRRNGQHESLKMTILKDAIQHKPQELSQTKMSLGNTLEPEYSMERNPNQYSAKVQQRLEKARATAQESFEDYEND